MKSKLGLIGVLVLATSLLSSSSKAADFPERTTLELASRSGGMAGMSAPKLSRDSGQGREATAWALLDVLDNDPRPVGTASISSIEQEKDYVFVRGDGWFLQVFADGSKVRFRNDAELASAENPTRLLAEKFSLAELELLGGQFISKTLSSFLPMGSNELLYPLQTFYNTRGGASADGVAEAERVVAHAVVFSRIVNGLSVVGPGSKVMVMFDNAKRPVGFDIDWSPLKLDQGNQSTVDLQQVLERQAVLSTIDGGNSIIELNHFECGYYDAGARRTRTGDPIQPACVSQYVHGGTSGGVSVRAGQIDVIPLGATVAPVPWWPEAGAIAAGDVCNVTPQDAPLFQLIPGSGGGSGL